MSHQSYFPIQQSYMGRTTTYFTDLESFTSQSSESESVTPTDPPSSVAGLRRYRHRADDGSRDKSSIHDPYLFAGGVFTYPTWTSHDMDENLLFSPSTLATTPSPEPISHTQQYSAAQTFTIEEGEDEEQITFSPTRPREPVDKGLKRRSQNREAQRRFRERKEEEKAQLTKRLRGLAAELGSTRQKVYALEAENERLVMELDLIRPLHRSFMSIMLAFPGLEPTTTTNLMLCDKP
ncbi:hypothetical protein BJX62DRAFT_242425 [Aspergillus germanicus]